MSLLPARTDLVDSFTCWFVSSMSCFDQDSVSCLFNIYLFLQLLWFKSFWMRYCRVKWLTHWHWGFFPVTFVIKVLVWLCPPTRWLGAQNARQRIGSWRKKGVGGKAGEWPTVTCWTPWIAGLSSPSMDGWPAPMGRDIALVQQVQWPLQ